MKRIILTTIQIGITVLLLWWIFHDPAKRAQMAEAMRTANYIWLIPGLLCFAIAFIFQTQRWRMLMAVQGIHMGWWRALAVFMIGGFFNLFLIGATGGDIVKIFYAMQETTSKKSAALLSVLVDRMMGLMAMVAVAIVLCSLRWDLITSHPAVLKLLGILVIVMGGATGMVVCGFIVDRFNLAHKLPHWIPMHAKIIELSTAFSIYARSPGVLAATFGLSVPAHILNFGAFYFAACAFGLFQSWSGLVDVLSVLPIIMTIAALPVSFAGVGVREGLFQEIFFTLFSTPKPVAAMISITGFTLMVFWGLVGGLIYLAYRPSGGLHMKELEHEVEEIEEKIEREA